MEYAASKESYTRPPETPTFTPIRYVVTPAPPTLTPTPLILSTTTESPVFQALEAPTSTPKLLISPTPHKDDMVYLGKYRVTFYCNCAKCCGKWAGGPTASGKYPRAQHTCACGSDIPFGTKLYVKGLGTFVCEDRGVGSGCIDIYVANHEDIPSWGMRYIETYITK